MRPASSCRMRRKRVGVFLALSLLPANPTPVWAAGCDLSELIGYQVVAGPTIQGYIDQDKQHNGFEGCMPGRNLVFTDHTGVRCKSMGLQHLELPRAYVFARSRSDMKLCVVDMLYDVAPMR